jgi:hypothetical protein
MANFGTCIFHLRSIPQSCEFNHPGTVKCSALDFHIVQCFLGHYGNRLAKDAPIRLIDAFTHLILDNDDFEEDDSEVPVDRILKTADEILGHPGISKAQHLRFKKEV